MKSKNVASGAILLRNTMAFDRSRAAEFKRAVVQAVDFARRNAPQLMVEVFVDDERALCYSFQMFENSEAIREHWEVSGPSISEVMKYCEVRSMEVYGIPSQEVRAGILASAGNGNVSFTPHLTGFQRFG